MPSYFDPESSGRQEEHRRYRKRLSSSYASPLLGTSASKLSEARLLCDGNNIQRRPNAGLLLEEIMQEAADFSDIDGLDGKLFGSVNRSASLDGVSFSGAGLSSGRLVVRSALKSVKLEDDMPHEGEATFSMFASRLDSAIQGFMPLLVLGKIVANHYRCLISQTVTMSIMWVLRPL